MDGIFDEIYAIDLVYEKDCWQRCGDAHCCNFSRYKSRFRFIGRTAEQELLLLPGEFEFLKHQGWLTQFGDFEHRVLDYAVGTRTMRIETIVSRRTHCACDHDTRPTICRLYPLFPIFEVDGRLAGIDARLGVYEELEHAEGLARACRIEGLPDGEKGKLVALCAAIARSPLCLFYAMAYRLAKEHVAARLAMGAGEDVFARFENLLISSTLIDHDSLKAGLSALADRFCAQYGSAFSLG